MYKYTPLQTLMQCVFLFIVTNGLWLCMTSVEEHSAGILAWAGLIGCLCALAAQATYLINQINHNESLS